jgi:hypothetical protein
MINTTGIQSTGPQGLPESSSQPAIANEQDEAQFTAMMAQPQSAATKPENKASQEDVKSKLELVQKPAFFMSSLTSGVCLFGVLAGDVYGVNDGVNEFGITEYCLVVNDT